MRELIESLISQYQSNGTAAVRMDIAAMSFEHRAMLAKALYCNNDIDSCVYATISLNTQNLTELESCGLFDKKLSIYDWTKSSSYNLTYSDNDTRVEVWSSRMNIDQLKELVTNAGFNVVKSYVNAYSCSIVIGKRQSIVIERNKR